MTETRLAPVDESTTTEEAIEVAGVLRWEKQDAEGWEVQECWMADNTAGVRSSDDPKNFSAFWIELPRDSERWTTIKSEGLVMPDHPPQTEFASKEAAMAWCEKRNAELVAAMLAESSPAIAKPAAEPFDVVKAAERYIADTIDRAENDEEEVTAKVIRQRSVVARLSIAISRLKAAEKQVKDKLEDEVDLLDSMERDAEADIKRKRDQPELPFGEKPAEPATDESWKLVRLDSLEPAIKPAKLKALEDNSPSIVTMGDWCAWQESKGEFAVKDVKGLGPGGAEQIEAATSKYFEDHPRVKSDQPSIANIDAGIGTRNIS